MLRKIYDSLLTVVYPQACHVCQNSVEKSSDGVACESCWKKTRIFCGAETLCGKCGAFLREKSSDFAAFCHACDEHAYDAARAVGVYEHALSASILHLKNEPFVARTLRALFIDAFENSAFGDAGLIVPVPLSKKRFLERGFNQAAVLARILAEHAAVDLDQTSLARTAHTPMHRAAMDRKAREMSVKNAFEVKRPKLIEGRNVLLVDDVFTSGATVSSCAEALKKKGAARVYVLTPARAV
jgi:ComF family protein